MHIKKGIKLLDEKLGSGKPVRKGDIVRIRTTGWLNGGDSIHSTSEDTVKIGSRRLIPGIESSVEGMKKGGIRKISVSPHLAYGSDGVKGKIPPNAVLIYEIEVTEIVNDVQPGTGPRWGNPGRKNG